MSGNPFKSSAELDGFKRVLSTLKNRLPTTVWIFESGDYVNLCSSDIKHAQDCLPPNNLRFFDVDYDDTTTKVVSVLASKCQQRLLQYILLAVHYRVSIFRFRNGSFTESLQGSPCDLSEVKDLMFTTSDDDLDDGGYSDKMLSLGPICAIVLDGDGKAPRVGAAFWHEASKSVKMAEFFDNTAHDKLESLLIQFNPMEAIVVENPKYRTVRKILERNKILATNLVSKKGMKAKTEVDIAKVFPKSHIEDNTVAAKAFSNLNQHLNVDLFADSKAMETINVEGFVHMNGQAVSGLNLFETASQSMSLYKVLNKTRTPGGGRLLRVWLRQPLTDKLKIEERLSIVESFINDTESRKTVYDATLRQIPDFQSLSVKLEEKKASLQDLYKCYLGAKQVNRLINCLDNMNTNLINETFVGPMARKADALKNFTGLVEATLDMVRGHQKRTRIKVLCFINLNVNCTTNLFSYVM